MFFIFRKCESLDSQSVAVIFTLNGEFSHWVLGRPFCRCVADVQTATFVQWTSLYESSPTKQTSRLFQTAKQQFEFWSSHQQSFEQSFICVKIAHLCIYMPPVFGAYLLHDHSPKPSTFSVPPPTQASQRETAVVRLSRTAHCPSPPSKWNILELPDKLPQGMLSSNTVPLLADKQTLRNKIQWSLKFLLLRPLNAPPAAASSSTAQSWAMW